MQISAASPSPNFYLGKSYVKENKCLLLSNLCQLLLPPFCWGGGKATVSPKFWKGGKKKKNGKNECLRGLKVFLTQIFTWEDYCILVKKDFVKYAVMVSVSKVDLGLFLPKNNV